MNNFSDIPLNEIDSVLDQSNRAFQQYRLQPLSKRAALLRAIAAELEDMGDAWIETAHRETNLPPERLSNERTRTIFQLESYGMACAQGDWMRICIDTALPDRHPPRPDLRKMMIPLGPVVVFGASNFPYAYSTAGGDTASALAAGCSVILKAHPAHPKTSAMAADAIARALEKTGMPVHLFQHVYGASFEVGKKLVQHPITSAVGFTGSFAGGKQLFDWANQRPHPIPVFAEMGSVNPIFLLPDVLEAQALAVAEKISISMNLGVGQFCTNPGVLIALDGLALDSFRKELVRLLQSVPPAPMLHSGIKQSYQEKTGWLSNQPGVEVLLSSQHQPGEMATPQLAQVTADKFMSDHALQQEIFGPASLLVVCRDTAEMLAVASTIEGQLTCSVFGTEKDLAANRSLLEKLPLKCGRLNFNSVPTGVEVIQSSHHGGPFPATTDARFTAVGSDAILRFARPVCYQNCPEELLPDELKSSNPLTIWRKVNGQWSNESIA